MVRGFVGHDVPDALKKCGLERYFFVRIRNITLCYRKFLLCLFSLTHNIQNSLFL